MTHFSLSSLRSLTPRDYARWASRGALLAALGYTAITVVAAVTEAPRSVPHLVLLALTAVSCWIGLALCRRDRPTAGASLVVFALWLEVHLSFVLTPELPATALMAAPLFVIGAGLLFGSRIALWTMLASIGVTIPLLVLSPAYARDGFVPRDVFWLALHGIVCAASWGLISVSLSALRAMFTTIQDRERELADLIAAAPDGILVLGSDAELITSNPAADRILGHPLAADRGRTIGAILADAGVANAEDALRQRPEGPADAVRLVRRVEGAPAVHIEVVQQPLAEGRLQLILRDASSRVVAEAAQREAEQRLAHAQRLEAVGQLAGGIAHDFNNLLMVIGGNAEQLQEERDPDERSTLLDEILGAQERGALLTHQLLAFARRDVVDPIVLDLGIMVGGLHRLLQRVAGEGVHVQCVATGDCRVRADVAQLEQVLVNLVANARDAMPGGGVCTVEVSGPTPPTAGAMVRLSVADTGVGMDAETAARVWEPFFTTKPRGRGTGLGLSTVHGIITHTGGSVAIDSTPGAGARVLISLPFVDAPASDTALVAPEAAQAGSGGTTILVAEDDDSTRAIVGRILRRGGYRVLLAPDGEQALRTLTTSPERIDMLVTDVIMPALNGRELAGRARELRPRLPILFMSGYPEDELSGVEWLDPSRDFIGKPFSAGELLKRVAAKLASAPIYGASDAPARAPR